MRCEIHKINFSLFLFTISMENFCCCSIKYKSTERFSLNHICIVCMYVCSLFVCVGFKMLSVFGWKKVWFSMNIDGDSYNEFIWICAYYSGFFHLSFRFAQIHINPPNDHHSCPLRWCVCVCVCVCLYNVCVINCFFLFS